jgi:FemAB-related protein (PEP-CTERM system-associated)
MPTTATALSTYRDFGADKPAAPRVDELRQQDESEWDAFVIASTSGTVFHLSAWIHLIEQSLGHHCIRLVARRGGTITGVFPLAWVRNRVFGDCLVSLPLAVYGGICADDQESYGCLLEAASSLGTKLGVRYVEMRNRTERFPTALPGRNLYVTFVQDLSPGVDKLMQGLPRDTRYMVRKSLKADLDWTENISIDEFYAIYARSVHRLGTPVFSKALFNTLRKELPQHSKLFGVRKHGKAIAAVLCLYFRDQVLPYYGGSLAEYNHDAPNTFMYWNLIKQSCLEGLQTFDFGRSKRGTGSCQFKSSWGMTVEPLPYRFDLIRATEIPHMTPVDPKFQLPVAAWKRMPFPLTTLIGPPLIRWIPSI